MTEPVSDFVRVLVERDYLYQATDLEALDAIAAGPEPLVGYIGFDCTAPSLHAGSMVQIMLLRRLQQAGGKPIVLLGGGTTKVGDPSGKDAARPVLTPADIETNKVGIRRVFDRFLTFGDGPTDAVMIDNADWLDTLNYIGFLRDYGRHFTINKMVQMESVKRRLDREQPLTFLEFNYMLLQAYDYLELYRRVGCRLQMGGSDQWGNIVNGADLVRRVDEGEVFGVTTPLLTTASGAKMGKTADGAVWLDGGMLAPYDFWQYWRDAEDADVGKFFRLFTDVPLSQIAEIDALQGAEINDAKTRLANEITSLAHGEKAAREAEAAAKAAFSGEAAEGLPSVDQPRARFAEGIPAPELFELAGLAASRGEARRHMQAGAAKVNGTPVTDPKAMVGESDLDSDGVVRLSVGKKKHALARAV
ncbi:MAG: tyrosine--tRNA ligase [Caulobacterales bacterium]|nr:tyrosine--tRNA ligase [Caulobacterales bacterium]